MDPKPAYKMINTLFADFGQDSRLNIVFPHLRPEDDPVPCRNFLDGPEMEYFYQEVVYVAAKEVLHDTVAQRVPLTHDIAMLKSRKADGHVGRCQLSIQVKALVEIVDVMRRILADMDDESMGARFRDFSFQLNVQNIKDACHVAYGQDGPSDSVTELLHSATLFIDWDQAEAVAEHVMVDYGIEWLPKYPVKPTTMAWHWPSLKKIIESHGSFSPDYDLFCHLHKSGGVRTKLRGTQAQNLGGAVYCQYYLGEKSLAYSYDLAHNRKRIKTKEILKNSSAFQHVMKLSNLVAVKGADQTLGARAEYRMTQRTDTDLKNFVKDLVELVFWNQAMIEYPSAAIFGLKQERNWAVAYMAQRLEEVTRTGDIMDRYMDVATYVRYIFLGTLSRPDDYSTTRQLVLDHQVRTNMEHLGLPIADWLSVRYLYMSPTSLYAALPQLPPPEYEAQSDEEMEDDNIWGDTLPYWFFQSEPPNFGAPPAEVVEADRRRAVDNRPTRQPQDPNSTSRHAARRAEVPTRARDRWQQARLLQQVVPAQVVNHYPDFMPDGITIEEQAKIIFARFKYDMANSMPSCEETFDIMGLL
ncbi:hypothetical protein GGH12_005267 [Coemansia sp. RSA 1822]|nr:hypothetical protein GGH12_005267 [Coemansia sp. RSA 1822]